MKKITIAIITLSLITSIIITNKESLVHAGYDRQGLITRIMQLIKERQGESLLSAVENNDLQKVKSLIASGTDLEYKRTYNQWNRWECMNTFNIREGEKKAPHYLATALDIAIEEKYYDIAKELAMNGAKIDSNTITQIPGITLKELLKLGVDINGDALINAVQNNDYELTKDLIDAGVNINRYCTFNNYRYGNALERAVSNKNETIIQLLKNSGAEKSNKNYYEMNQQEKNDTLIYLIEKGNFEEAEKIIKAGADVKAKDYCGDESLPLKALQHKNLDFAKKLISLGAPLHNNDAMNYMELYSLPSSLSYKGFDINTLKELISLGADINAEVKHNRHTNTILLAATEDKNIELLTTALELGASPNKTAMRTSDDFGRTLEESPLTNTCDSKTIDILIQAGANPFLKMNGTRDYSFYNFITKCKEYPIKDSIYSQLNLNERDENGDPILIRMIKKDYEYYGDYGPLHSPDIKDRFQELIDLGLNVNLADQKGYTLLMKAAKNNDYETASRLIFIGADINKTDIDNGTALMEAAYHKSYEIARLLIESRANKNIKDKRGYTALDYAKMKKPGYIDRYDSVQKIIELLTN